MNNDAEKRMDQYMNNANMEQYDMPISKDEMISHVLLILFVLPFVFYFFVNMWLEAAFHRFGMLPWVYSVPYAVVPLMIPAIVAFPRQRGRIVLGVIVCVLSYSLVRWFKYVITIT